MRPECGPRDDFASLTSPNRKLICLLIFFFSDAESTAGPYESRHEGKRVDIIYATFTTPANAISGSAVCAFRLHDVEKVFDGAFKEQAALNYNWLPVATHKVT